MIRGNRKWIWGPRYFDGFFLIGCDWYSTSNDVLLFLYHFFNLCPSTSQEAASARCHHWCSLRFWSLSASFWLADELVVAPNSAFKIRIIIITLISIILRLKFAFLFGFWKRMVLNPLPWTAALCGTLWHCFLGNANPTCLKKNGGIIYL